MTRQPAKRWRHVVNRATLLAPIALLLIMFFLRADRITGQPAFIDESYHVQRSILVWQFSENPGLFSNGKVLLYYWLGLFQGDRSTALFAARIAVALFALISGAALYRISVDLANRRVGMIALSLYAILPLALFHERMALADPFAGAFGCLVAWRSLHFARHPAWRDGVILGMLLALATLAKLTMALLPLLPVCLSMAWCWQSDRPTSIGSLVRQWGRAYFWPLAIAALILVIAWLPLVIPAYLARDSAQPFVLVNEKNIDRTFSPIAPTIDAYGYQLARSLYDYLGAALPIAIVSWLGWLALLMNRDWAISGESRRRMAGMIVVTGSWIFCLGAPTLLLASQVTARYLMPIAAPIALILAYTIDRLWRSPAAFTWMVTIRRFAIAGIGAVWLITYALPFAITAIAAPEALPLDSLNASQYLRGVASANRWVFAIAADLNNQRGNILPVYGEWEICNQLYFYATSPITCFPRSPNYDPLELPAQIRAVAVKPMLLALNTYHYRPAQLADVCALPIDQFPDTGIVNETPALWQIAPMVMTNTAHNWICGF